ncbi:hypothetical protein [Herbidospora sp. RD11066]
MGLLSNLLLPGRLRTGPTVLLPAKTKPEAILELVRLADPQAELDGADVLAAATRIHDGIELTGDLAKKLGLDVEEKLWAHRVVAERPLPVDYYDKLLAAGLAYRLGGYCLCEGSADDPAEDVELEYAVYLPAVEESELTPALIKILGTEEDTATESAETASEASDDTSATEAAESIQSGAEDATSAPEGTATDGEPGDAASGTGETADTADAPKTTTEAASADDRPHDTAADDANANEASAGAASGKAAENAGNRSADGTATLSEDLDAKTTADAETADADSDAKAADANAGANEAGAAAGAETVDADADADKAVDAETAEAEAAKARKSLWSSDGVYEAGGFRVSVTPVHRFPASVAGLMPYATEVVKITVSVTGELEGDARMLDPGNVALALGTALDGPVVDHWGFQVFEPADLLPPRSV